MASCQWTGSSICSVSSRLKREKRFNMQVNHSMISHASLLHLCRVRLHSIDQTEPFFLSSFVRSPIIEPSISFFECRSSFHRLLTVHAQECTMNLFFFCSIVMKMSKVKNLTSNVHAFEKKEKKKKKGDSKTSFRIHCNRGC